MKSPDFINFMKSFIQNPQSLQLMNNLPEAKKLRETEPEFCKLLDDKKLMEKLLTPEIFQVFVQIIEIDRNKDKIDNNNNKNFNYNLNNVFTNYPNNNIDLLAPQQKKENNYSSNLEKKADNNSKELNYMIKKQNKELKQKIKYFYTYPKDYQENLKKLKDMGYDEEKIKKALIINDGVLDAALNYLNRHNKIKNKNKNQDDKEDEK